MSVISSESIFHFTDSKEKLIGILKDEFYPHFCPERIDLGDMVIKGAFPMVCFCDIPLSLVKEHIGQYGPYGIGMLKSWGERMGLNPVLYLKKDSHLSAHIQGLLRIMVQLADKSAGQLTEEQLTLTSITRYIKPFEGKYLRGETRAEKIKFYDERELRYVPPPERTKNRYLFLTEERYKNKEIRTQWNLEIREAKLSFEPNDIRYIIINKDIEIPELVEAINQLDGTKYNDKAKTKLVTRIISRQQIEEDF